MASSSFVDPASASRADESDLDPAAFLKSVRELSEKREREDAERYRKLEEDIERSKQARAARRADRARSISPQKGSTSTPTPLRSSSNVNSVASPPPMTPPESASTTMDSNTSTVSTSTANDVPEFRGFGSSSKSKVNMPSSQSPAQASETSESASKPSPSASTLARSGTLSWQQRPSSRGGTRPTSMLATNSLPSQTAVSAESEPSRDQIAASLGARDPSWFRQTADRGVGNAAYRKTSEETSTSETFVSGRRGLPGMSQKSTTQSTTREISPPPEPVKSVTPARAGIVQENASSISATTPATSSKPDLKTLIAEDESQAKASPMSEQTASSNTNGEQIILERTPTITSSQTRIANAPERPGSPTKGMGGFVQSAMMKRSDSVTKRWSAQPSVGLARGDSIRSGYGGLTGSHSMPKMDPTSSSGEVVDKPASKLSSVSSINLTDSTTAQGREGGSPTRSSLPSHGRSQSVASSYNTTAEDTQTSPPVSPSKRWSPAKSTWLESAISKPESPKPSPARNSQPSWMADIAKAKAQRANIDSAPKIDEKSASRSSSPTKEPFGQSILKPSEPRDLGTPVSLTPKTFEQSTPRPLSPSKTGGGISSTRSLEPQKVESTSGAAVKRPDPEATITPDKPDITPVGRTETKQAVASSALSNPPKLKPETPPKPQTDFRSNLRSRPQAETKQGEQPEFLSRFGQLRKTQTQNYVAPDVLKDNILRGKGDLAKTDGPVKTQRKDEFKDSLLAKKDQWKDDKEKGIVHERKVSQPPITPQKAEALAKRDVLGRSETVKVTSSPEKPKTATPEALARHKSLKEKSQTDPPEPGLEKQLSAPTPTPLEKPFSAVPQITSVPAASAPPTSVKGTETSKLAARFNPALAGVISRGPAAVTSESSETSRSQTPATFERSLTPRASAPSEPMADGSQLQDMRKGRAKGPKKRKGATKDAEAVPSTEVVAETFERSISESTETSVVSTDASANEPIANEKPKPRALPGSAASIMMASLKNPVAVPENVREPQKPLTSLSTPVTASQKPFIEKPSTPVGSSVMSNSKYAALTPTSTIGNRRISGPRPLVEKPTAPAKSPALVAKSEPSKDKSPPELQQSSVPEFKGFGPVKKSNFSPEPLDDNKENAVDGSPSVKSAVSQWGKPATTEKTQPPAQISLPSRRDEEAALKSAGLLASSPTRPASSNGLGINVEKSNGAVEIPPPSSGAPPRPVKSSRAVSGQQRDVSPDKTDAARLLVRTFGTLPTSSGPLSIDTQAVITSSPHQDRTFKTVRKTVQVVAADGSRRELLQHEEYTFFDESAYICNHTYTVADGPKKAELFLWNGDSSPRAAVEQAEATAKRLAKDIGNVPVSAVSQGLEPPGFLQALGGILITRRGSQQGAAKQYMLRGRKHLGQIVFDEVDFKVNALSSGFAYLISYYATLQDTRFYLWKGSACSAEEISAARLAAADLSEAREVIEVDDGAEFSSFLKIFGPGTAKASIPKPSEMWQLKSTAPDRFATRLFRIQPTEAKAGIFSSMFRRPSWGNLSPARRGEDQAKLEVKELSPFTQSDLESDCIYLLDAYTATYVLIGPMLPTQSESVRNLLFSQTLLFASDYAMLAASTDDRPYVPKGYVVLNGVPQELRVLFRHWDENAGLWSGGGVPATKSNDLNMVDLDQALAIVCKS